MKSGWRLKGKPAAPALKFSLEHVLVYYDEPQVITARDQYDTRYLAVAVDDSDDCEIVRWVYSPISDLEFHALICGGTSVRDALSGDTVIVADRRVDGGVIEEMWRIADTDIPESVRPAPDSFLPGSVRDYFAQAVTTEPEIRIAGKPVSGSQISFIDLGSVVNLTQKLWHAIAGAIYYKKTPSERSAGEGFLPSTMMVAGTGIGSFAIKIKPVEDAIFNHIASEYRKLLEASRGEAELKEAINKYGGDVASSFYEYMSFLDVGKIDVFTQSPKTTAFVSSRRATRIVGYVGPRKKRKKKDEELEVPAETFTAEGYFEGYSYISKRFDFVGTKDNEIYSGDVEESVLTGHPIERGLMLSSKTIYTAEIRPVRRGDRQLYTLLGFWLTEEKRPIGIIKKD